MCQPCRQLDQVQYSALSHRGAVHLDLARGAGAGVAAGAMVLFAQPDVEVSYNIYNGGTPNGWFKGKISLIIK